MTRDEFIGRYEDVLTGLLLRAYADVVPRLGDEDDARLGRRMRQMQQKARHLLGQMYDALHPDPAANGAAKPQPARKA